MGLILINIFAASSIHIMANYAKAPSFSIQLKHATLLGIGFPRVFCTQDREKKSGSLGPYHEIHETRNRPVVEDPKTRTFASPYN